MPQMLSGNECLSPPDVTSLFQRLPLKLFGFLTSPSLTQNSSKLQKKTKEEEAEVYTVLIQGSSFKIKMGNK